MFPGRTRWPRFILAIYLLVCLVAVAALLAQRPFAVESSATPGRIRDVSWTFAPDEFQQEDDAYLSPVRRAPYDFTAAGVHFEPGKTTDVFPSVELRLRADGGDWSPWYTIGDFEPEANGRVYGENLVAWSAAREAQVRVRAFEPLEDAVRNLTIIAIDANDGPTAAQAAASAKARITAQAATDGGNLGVPQPIVISRAEWGANESWMTWSPQYAPVDKAIIHHTVSGGGTDPAAEVRAIYSYHAVTRGWGDIGYNFVVDPFGNIYEGRSGGPDVIGAHVANWNEGSMGVSVLGCYDYESCIAPRVPTGESLNAIADVVAWMSSRRVIDPRQLRNFSNGYSTVTNYVLAGHRDYGSTVCPGDNLYAELPNLRQMSWQRVPEYDVRFGWQNTPSAMRAGDQVTVYPVLYNYGRLVWSDNAGVRLGYRWLKDGRVVAERTDAARIIPGAVVNFGEMTALVAQLTAPSIGGSFTLRWDLYRDGVGWFADQPAPAGRSHPLDVAVEVTPGLSLDVRLDPVSVSGGDSLNVDIIVEGPAGRGFETRTRLPLGVGFVANSGYSDVGNVRLEYDEVIWTGTLAPAALRAGFDVLVSSEFTTPLAFSTTTTLNVPDYLPVVITRWFIANGYHHYLPLVARAWTK
jgi:hypothetical protein